VILKVRQPERIYIELNRLFRPKKLTLKSTFGYFSTIFDKPSYKLLEPLKNTFLLSMKNVKIDARWRQWYIIYLEICNYLVVRFLGKLPVAPSGAAIGSIFILKILINVYLSFEIRDNPPLFLISQLKRWKWLLNSNWSSWTRNYETFLPLNSSLKKGMINDNKYTTGSPSKRVQLNKLLKTFKG